VLEQVNFATHADPSALSTCYSQTFGTISACPLFLPLWPFECALKSPKRAVQLLQPDIGGRHKSSHLHQ
jgi:hypothetical protein